MGPRAVASAVLAAILLLASFGGARSEALDASDVALLEEAFRLQRTLGPHVWPTWGPSEAPVLYKAAGTDHLVGHPSPPARFEQSDTFFRGQQVWVAKSEDANEYLAAFPVEGVWTAVVSRPGPSRDPAHWIVLFAHELFHVWQRTQRPDRVLEPFVGTHASKHELSFPFPYDDAAVQGLMRLEAEQIFRATTGDSLSPNSARRAVRLLGHVDAIGPAAFTDSLAFVYKKWMEWNEGVARYTEREIALLASDSDQYTPSADFTRHFPEASFGALHDRYTGALNPIRFVGEGVRGRMSFYYAGMGKAYLLERLLPHWKELYFEAGLDSLIATASSGPLCTLE